MNKAPAVGKTATVSFDVSAQAPVTGATLQADLPGFLRWANLPKGLTPLRVASAVPGNGGTVNRAAAVVDLSSGETRHFQGNVTAVRSGDAEVQVRLLGPSQTATDHAADEVFVTAGPTERGSYLGSRRHEPRVNATAPAPSGTSLHASTRLGYKRVGPARPSIRTGALTCFKGSFSYTDQDGVTHPSVNLQVQLWRSRGFFGDSDLSDDVTDQNGNYRLCSTRAAGGDDYIMFVTENGQWAVRDYNDNPYQFHSNTFTNVGNGTTTDVGALQPADTKFMRGLHAFDEANDAKSWTPGACWNANDHDCRLIPFEWTWDPSKQVSGNFYSTDDKHIHLRTAAPDSRSVVVHELGHAVMDNIYNDNFPPAPNCSPHTIQGHSSTGCAWTEGFADWYQTAVYSDPEYVDREQGFTVDLETPTWGTTGWDNGDSVEGRVAAAMNDIANFPFEKYWDSYGEGEPGNMWKTLLKHVSNTFHDFWSQRGQDGFNVSDAPQASLYQNTIDYGFRNPLIGYQPLVRPTPVPAPQNYHYATSVVYWSVVAARPPAGGSLEVDMYADHDQKQLLAASKEGNDVVPFVAVDSNRRPLGNYYPRIAIPSTDVGEYQIELADGAHLLAPSQNITMTAPNDVVAARDNCVPATTKMTITATPSDPSQDAELFVFASDPNNSATWVQPRAFAAAKAGGGGAGKPETITYTAPTEACYGIVLINKAGSGTYTLTSSNTSS